MLRSSRQRSSGFGGVGLAAPAGELVHDIAQLPALGIEVAPQPAHQPTGLTQPRPFLVEAAGQDAVLDIIDLIAEIVDQRFEGLGQMIQEMGEQRDGRAEHSAGQNLSAEAIDRLQRMAPPADHETRLGDESNDAEAFGIEVEVVMQIAQHADKPRDHLLGLNHFIAVQLVQFRLVGDGGD